MKNRNLANRFCLSGIIGLVFYILHDLVGAMYYPNYNRMSQAVSDLTAIDAPSFVIASGLSSIYGIFSCLCCSMVCIVVQNRANKFLRLGVYLFTAMNFISAIGYLLFPLSGSGYAGNFQDIIHLYVVTALVVVLSVASLGLIAVGGLKSKGHKPLAIIALFSLGFMVMGVIGVNTVPPVYFGILERFSVYSAVVFNAALGLYGYLER
ncbi:MAG: DUF998 domain-containing protein [Treponema sp.]|nr:DUF998 domain-containing protein [Treponema sp.]